jgi:hypothetical protein
VTDKLDANDVAAAQGSAGLAAALDAMVKNAPDLAQKPAAEAKSWLWLGLQAATRSENKVPLERNIHATIHDGLTAELDDDSILKILVEDLGLKTAEAERRLQAAIDGTDTPPAEPEALAQPHAQTDKRPQSFHLKDLLQYDAADDSECLLGARYLCRGQSLLLPGPTGIGKSSLVMQMALVLAAGEPFFGITPKQPLKSLLLQAENDTGDLSEMARGVVNGLGLPVSKIEHKLTVITETSVCGPAFHPWAKALIIKHQPDLVIVDPVFAYIGGNASDQGIVSTWLRNGLGTISAETGATWILVHHVRKPADVEFERKNADYAYAGFGSVEFANFCRGVLNLRDVGGGRFELRAAKRGKRAGLLDNNGHPTDAIYLRHGRSGIFWERADEPEDARLEGELADALKLFGAMEPGTDYNVNGLIELAEKTLKITRGNFTSPIKRGFRVLQIVKKQTKNPVKTGCYIKPSADTKLFAGGIQ